MLTAIGDTLNRVSDTEIKRKQVFGRLVRQLREGRKFSRSYLEAQSGVPERTLIDIENGEKAMLDRKTVYLLAHAFSLAALPEREFILAAGLWPDVRQLAAEPAQVARRFYDQMDYPACIMDSLLDLHSCNAYLLAMLNVPIQKLNECAYTSAGPNVLRFLFDPDLHAREVWQDSWAELALWNVYLFRLSSQPRRHEPRYEQLLAALNQLPDFEAIWQSADGLVAGPMPPHVSTLGSPFGRMRVLHTEPLSHEISNYHLRAELYVPMDDATQRAFVSLRGQTPRAAFQFGSCAVARYTRLS